MAINDYTGTSGYSAEASGATVTITAAVGTGATVNGAAVVLTPGGNLTASTTDMAGGVTEVAAVAQIELVEITGTIEIEDSFSVTINGTPYTTTALAAGMGTSLFIHKKRVWSPTGSIWRYCKLNDATNWTDGTASTGAGFINVSTDSEGAQELIAAAVYQGLAAVFARENIVLYQLSTDSADFAYSDTIANTGTVAAGSVVPYGNTDVFYLDDTGIRSIRSRDGTNAAYTSDVGSAIDPYVTDLIASVTESAAAAAEAIVDPVDGRYMLAVGETIVALSYFPDSKISAWSYLAQGYSIDDLVRSNRDIYLRSGDTIYRYGGADGATYPDAGEFETVAETAFMDARDPAARKLLQGFDMACEGEWLVEVLIDPNDTTKKVTVGRIDAVTYHKPAINLPEKTSHIAFRFTADKAGYASLSSLAVHFEGEEKG